MRFVRRYGGAVQLYAPRTKSRISRALGRLRTINDMRGPATRIIAAVMRLAATVRLAALVLASALACAFSGGAVAVAKAGCVPLPHTFVPFARSGSKLTVRVGTILYAIESLPPMQTGTTAAGFPWRPPVSSDQSVLATVRRCTTKVMTMEGPEGVFAFRALRAGSATLHADLTSQWRHTTHPPPPYRATINVR